MSESSQIQTVTLGGGCFWCLEAVFLQVRGVLTVESGYCNGQAEQPSYESVCSGQTGCVEVVRLQFDPNQIGMRDLLEIFFLVHDPTTLNRQGHDVGTQYRSGIYFHEGEQEAQARQFIAELVSRSVYEQPIVTEVLPVQHYWPAEPYHQNYFARNPGQGYCQHVVRPKVEKFRQRLAQWVRR
jgi:peptide-methionine (S)-S-oxide reductase